MFRTNVVCFVVFFFDLCTLLTNSKNLEKIDMGGFGEKNDQFVRRCLICFRVGIKQLIKYVVLLFVK